MKHAAPLALGLASLASVAAASCGTPPTFIPFDNLNGPRGVLDGTLTYSGPLPCTENQHVVGAAAILVLDTRLLPPPEGLGTGAQNFAAVGGDTLFAGVSDRLTFNADGSRWCPAPGSSVVVSADWAAAPLDAATYEVRGFYDLAGTFDPGFSILNLPVKGDIGGGAIDNPAAVLAGQPPSYRRITLGVPGGDAGDGLMIPDTGARVSGVAITLGLPLPLQRPVFYPKGVLVNGQPGDPSKVVLPSDFQLEEFSTGNPVASETSLVRYQLGAGVPPSEVAPAAAPPFLMPVGGAAPPTFLYSRQAARIPETALIPALYPIAVFARLQDCAAGAPCLDGSNDLVGQGPQVDPTSGTLVAAPVVVLQGLTIYKSLTQTAFSPPTLSDPQPEVIVGLRPSTLCIDPLNPTAHGVLVVTHEKDKKGNPVVSDPKTVEAALAAQFGRPIDIVYGCLPQGRYSMNLIYGTSQAWTLPNEAGICAADEAASPGKCGTRAKLASQATVLTIGAPGDAKYCTMNPTPAACVAPPPPSSQ